MMTASNTHRPEIAYISGLSTRVRFMDCSCAAPEPLNPSSEALLLNPLYGLLTAIAEDALRRSRSLIFDRRLLKMAEDVCSSPRGKVPSITIAQALSSQQLHLLMAVFHSAILCVLSSGASWLRQTAAHGCT